MGLGKGVEGLTLLTGTSKIPTVDSVFIHSLGLYRTLRLAYLSKKIIVLT